VIILIVIIAALAILAVKVIGVDNMVATQSYDAAIVNIEEQMQDSNGVQTMNYLPLIAEDVNWSDIGDEKRVGIAKYAVGEALKKAETDQVAAFNIMGMTYDRMPAFLYSPDGRIQIIVNGEVTSDTQVE
jgi:hypothetical protein